MALKDTYFTISEAAREASVTRQTVSRWIREGKLPAERIGRETLIKKQDMRKYQVSLSAADAVIAVVMAARNDFCHERFALKKTERVRELKKRRGEWYLILRQHNNTMRPFKLPIPFEQWEEEFREYTRPILAEFLSKLEPVMKQVLGEVEGSETPKRGKKSRKQ
jgi:excisionase family DNA binding protein